MSAQFDMILRLKKYQSIMSHKTLCKPYLNSAQIQLIVIIKIMFYVNLYLPKQHKIGFRIKIKIQIKHNQRKG